MKIKILKVGPLETNCYLLEEKNKMLLIDPGDDYDFIESHLTKEVIGILLTHHHFDHVGALKQLLTKHPVAIYDYDSFKEEKEYEIGPFTFEVLWTPGHTKDSTTYYFKQDAALFCGDFLFKEEVGRVDLPGGSELDMIQSLKKIYLYPNNITIYPGHGDMSSLGYEKKNNRYLKEYGKNE